MINLRIVYTQLLICFEICREQDAMSELISFNFSKKYQDVNHFLTTQNKVAFTKDHKFIYGSGKEMNHTEILQKLGNLASSLHTSRTSLHPEAKRAISTVLSNISQLTEAKLNGVVPSNKSSQMHVERLEDVGRLAVDLGVPLQVPLTHDKRVILEQKWSMPSDEEKPNSLQKNFTLQRFADGKMQLISEVAAKPMIKSSPRISRASNFGELSRAGNLSEVKGELKISDFNTTRTSLVQNLNLSEKKMLIDQIYQSLFGERPTGGSLNFIEQVTKLSQALHIDPRNFVGVEGIATEIIAKTISEKTSPEALYTSINSLDTSIRYDLQDLTHLKIRGEISREGGIPSINLQMKGTLPADIIDDRGGVIKKSNLQIDVHFNPITKEHTESTLIL